MSWTIDRTKPVKRKSQANDPGSVARNVKFDEYVARKYQDLQAEVEKEKEELKQRIEVLEKERVALQGATSRGLLRRKKQVQREWEQLTARWEEHQQGLKLQEFRQKTLPYTVAYDRELQVLSMERLRTLTSQASLLPKDDERDHRAAITSDVMKDFVHDIENVPLKVVPMPNEICEECDNVMVLESRSSTLVCPCCGNWKAYLDATSSHMAYGEEVEFTAFAYLRMNHFNERLTYSQAKESTRISLEDIQSIMDRIIERRITDLDKITPELTYAMAKELKMRHVYKQNTQLWCRITGKPPKRMTPEQEEQLRSMFRAVNRLWPKYKPDERKNFLSYNYLLYKFCQLLGMDQFCGLYKLLKGDKKLEKQDEIFKQICEDPELNWEFIPSRHTD